MKRTFGKLKTMRKRPESFIQDQGVCASITWRLIKAEADLAETQRLGIPKPSPKFKK
jgi:hypothetical protein